MFPILSMSIHKWRVRQGLRQSVNLDGDSEKRLRRYSVCGESVNKVKLFDLELKVNLFQDQKVSFHISYTKLISSVPFNLLTVA